MNVLYKHKMYTEEKVVCYIKCFFSLEIFQKTSIEGSLQSKIFIEWKICLKLEFIFKETNIPTKTSEFLRQFEQCSFCWENIIVSPVNTQNVFDGRLQCVT